ncbi:diguanylate cyclase [Alteromonas facilis]|uniref:tetratricopeptide repeat-containing diguanylate cyclase n=1 Tax=Alteromonas facilis TaxID=2048004 RepID=UPI000C28E6C2|nr:diguanylate cyclase [Alteromonas facilis]
MNDTSAQIKEPLYTDWPAEIKTQLEALDADPRPVITDTLNHLKALDNDASNSATSRAEWLYVLSQAYYAQVKPDQALWHADQGLTLTNKAAQPWLYNQLLLAKANAFDLAGTAERGLPLVNEVLAWAQEKQDMPLLQNAMISKGLLDLTLGDNNSALNQLQTAEHLSDFPGTYDKGHIASYIALVYEYRGDNTEAIDYFNHASEYYRTNEKWLQLSNTTYGLGRAYIALGNLSEGKKELEESLALSIQISDSQGEAYTLKELASLYATQGDLAQARTFLKQSIDIFSTTYNPYMMLNTHMILTELAIQEGDYEQALAAVEKALSYVTGESMRPHQLDGQMLKARILALMKRFEEAYELLARSEKEAQLYRQQQSESEFQRMRTAFQLDKQEANNALLSAENERQIALIMAKNQGQLLWAVSTIFVVILCVILLILYYNGKRSKARFERLAHHDSLTGLYSRHFVLESLENLLSQAQRHKEPLSVAMIDIDFFKQLNDTYGHSAGDAVLSRFATVADDTFRDSDILGRIGGEEFLFIFPRTTAEDTAYRMESFAQIVQKIPKRLQLPEWELTLSIGIYSVEQNSTVESILHRSDEGLYQAKNSGRNKIVIVNT